MLETFRQFKTYANQNGKLKVLHDDEIHQVQMVLLDMMDDFVSICERNGLRYFLTGGSALGAVRNEGFIPWDDDIDVIMPRSDYERLAECVKKEPGDKYWLQGLKNSEKYDLTYYKFRKKGTRYIEIFDNDYDDAGVFIDVFPLEDMYDNPIVRAVNGVIDEFLFLIASCVRIFNKKDRLLEYVKGSPMERTVRLKAAFGRVFSSGKDDRIWFKRCDRWQSKCVNPDSKYVTVSCGRGHYFGETYLRERLFPVQHMSFEGRQYAVPRDPDYLLRKLYGKGYMIPADEKDREVHCVIELDLGTGEGENDEQHK